MESKCNVTQMELTRQERLTVWMFREKLTSADIGRKLGITRTSAYRLLFECETIPPMRHEELSKIIPSELLPDAVYQKPGPKPKAEAQQVA